MTVSQRNDPADVASGPLSGVTVVEMAGLGPAPYAAGFLADLGATVTRISAPTADAPLPWTVDGSTRMTRTLDLRTDAGRSGALDEICGSDILIEGFRPGVMERLGLAPHRCHEVNPGLVYGRITGWGQHGPLAQRAGHDINFLALSGALSMIGPPGDRPVVPVNMVADFGGGAMFLIAGVLAGLVARSSGRAGCVVDAAMVDGVGSLLDTVWTLRAAGEWQKPRGHNLLDGGAPFYDTYTCADGGWIAVGALEPRFYALVLEGLQEFADVTGWPDQYDDERWDELRGALGRVFALHERDFWAARFAETDACVTPVLSLDESVRHPHLRARRAHVENQAGAVRAAPAPRVAFASAAEH